TYTPGTDVTGADSFRVTASDGGLDSDPVTVEIAIANHAPACADAAPAGAAEDTDQTGTVACTDQDNDPLIYAKASEPAHGTVSLNPGTGAWTYTPAANYNGTDSFTFKANDGTADSVTRTISITVAAVNDIPVANAAAVPVTEDIATPITLTGSDVEGSALTYAVVTPPAHGTLTGTVPNLTYSPAANYDGADSFTFRANDGAADSTTQTISITVTAVNDAPDARTDGFTVNATSTGTLAVLANDFSGPAIGSVTSEPTDAVRVTAVTQGTKISVSIAPGGTGITYDVKACAYGGDSFTYTVTDSLGLTDTATAFVTVARPGQNGLSINPLTDVPALGLITNSTLGTYTIPARLSWCGVTRSPYGIRSYTVQQSTNAGATYPSTIVSRTTAKSSTRNLRASTTYRWRARTTDTGGRTGSYRYSLTARIGRYQENHPAIRYTGTWKGQAVSSASGGAERYTSGAGSTATITLTNIRQFAIVGPRSSGRRSFEVWVDGTRVATISERATTTVYRRVLYVRSVTSGPGVSHTIQIRAVGNGRIDLDAILALS
ncbi:MAG: Ig-like domain-containing protein, partial [Candidatus Limnocylindrales bacterium]